LYFIILNKNAFLEFHAVGGKIQYFCVEEKSSTEATLPTTTRLKLMRLSSTDEMWFFKETI
jgi:hypothetical protein